MSHQITVNDKTFEPSSLLAEQFNYSVDYISKLAREGKVEATRVGRQWFIERDSLKNFVEAITAKKEADRKRLREERKREHQAATTGQSTNSSTTAGVAPQGMSAPAPAATVRALAPQKYTLSRNGLPVSRFFDIASAMTGTALVLVAGVLGGIALMPTQFLALIGGNERALVIPGAEHVERTTAVPGAAVTALDRSVPAPSVPATLPASTTLERGVVVLDSGVSAEEIERIKASFSDEVEVEFTSEDQGIITPVFREGHGSEYQFLMVPVTDSS